MFLLPKLFNGWELLLLDGKDKDIYRWVRRKERTVQIQFGGTGGGGGEGFNNSTRTNTSMSDDKNYDDNNDDDDEDPSLVEGL
jgi:hypothetical protein